MYKTKTRVYYCIILLQITGAKSAGKLCLWVKFEWSSLNAARPKTTALQTTLYSGSEQRVYFKCKLVMLVSGWEWGFWWWVGWEKETQYSSNMIPWVRYDPLRQILVQAWLTGTQTWWSLSDMRIAGATTLLIISMSAKTHSSRGDVMRKSPLKRACSP